MAKKQRLMDLEDMELEDKAYIAATEALMPLVELYQAGCGMPIRNAPHMISPWILYCLSSYLKQKTSLPTSRNIRLLLVPDQKNPDEEWPDYLTTTER